MALAMAGLLLIAGGLLRVGTLMKYVPQPVITGFTAGIAVSILLGQVKDFFGLRMAVAPGDFFARSGVYGQHFSSFSVTATSVIRRNPYDGAPAPRLHSLVSVSRHITCHPASHVCRPRER